MSKTISVQSITIGALGVANGGTGLSTPRPTHITLARATSTTSASGVDPTTSSASLTDLGTSFVPIGGMVMITMDTFTTITVNARVGNAPAQGGTVSVEIYDATGAASLVTATTTSVGLTNITATAAIALTGVCMLHARIKSSVATDDPIANWIGIELT